MLCETCTEYITVILYLQRKIMDEVSALRVLYIYTCINLTMWGAWWFFEHFSVAKTKWGCAMCAEMYKLVNKSGLGPLFMFQDHFIFSAFVGTIFAKKLGFESKLLTLSLYVNTCIPKETNANPTFANMVPTISSNIK